MTPRAIALLTGVIIVVGLTAWWGSAWFGARAQHDVAAPARTAVTVRTQAIKSRTLPQSLSLTGTVRAQRTATIATRVSGTITELSVEEGDRVAEGQVVARVDVSNVTAQAAQAEAGVDLAEATVRESEGGITRAQAGERAAAARNEELQAQLRSAQAAQRQAELDRSRVAYMYKEDAVSKADFEQADTHLRVARANVASAEAGIRQAQAEQAQARAAVQQSHASVARTQAAVSVAKSGVQVAQSDLAYGTLRAPFAGAVTRKLAHLGDLTSPGRTLLLIEDVEHLHLDVDSPEENLKSLRIGQAVRIGIDSVNGDLAGRVYQIVPAADPQTHSFVVKIHLPAHQGLLPGMFGRVQLERGRRTALLVPRSALLPRGQLVGVYVVDGTGVARLRLVKTADSAARSPAPGAQEVEVLSGLSDGDVIVLEPPTSLSDGTPVRVQNDASPAGVRK